MGVEPLPNFCTDLNHMHDAENTLKTEEEKRRYVDFLVCEMKQGEFTVMANAKSRAVALLKMKGLWHD